MSGSGCREARCWCHDAGAKKPLAGFCSACGCAHTPDVGHILRQIARVLTPTDPSAFSAEDERARIGSAHVLIAQALYGLEHGE